jgi:hypothetical protein
MIVPNQSNLKVHFAGAESLIRSNIMSDGAGVKYKLFTIFPFLLNKLNIKHGYQTNKVTYDEISLNNYNTSNHCIQDSGLFSLMFGSHKGPKDSSFIEKWYELLIETTLNGKFNGTVVEVDCQKVLGVEKAWEYRMKMKKDLPNNRQINVFHKEDGQKGLDRLIEFSDYIAISVPELRALKQKNYTTQIAHYIKNKKPTIDIHLLGCTENKLLKELSFCSSADSTSWVSFNKFGWFKYNDGVKTISIKKSNIDKTKFEKVYYDRLKEIVFKSKIKVTDSILYFHSCDLMQLEYLLKQYSIYAGPQN